MADKSHFISARRKHQVYLGNGLNVLFSNINEVTGFLAKTNKFLNAKIFELNELYIEIFSNYQRLWFFFNNSTELLDSERIVESNLYLIPRNLTMMVTRSGFENGNQFVFLQFQKSINALIKTIEVLQEVQKDRYNYLESNTLNTLKERCFSLQKQIETYGFDEYEHTPLSEMGIKTTIAE